MKDMKEELNKDIEILQKNQSQINSSLSQLNISIEILVRRVKQIDNKVSGTKDKVEKLDQTVKEQEKNPEKTRMEHARHLRYHEKTKPMNHGYWRSRET
jgi:methyl-accepting chemotaxis protein